jgi:pimeloyl-ACP methyl ester carboxylesterase
MIGLLMLMGLALALLIILLTAMLAWEMVHPPRHTMAWALARKLPSDPGDLGLPFDEWWLERSDGARLAVWEIDVGGRRSDTRERSASGAITAVFVHGESTGPSTLGAGEDEDLLALVHRLGTGPFVLIGHSMGAVIALRAAAKIARSRAESEGKVVGVVAYAPYCEFRRSLQGRLRVNGLPVRPLTDLALLVHRLCGLTPASLDPRTLSDLPTPVLVIHGVDDAVVPLEHARRIVDAVPDAMLVDVHGAAHSDAHSVDVARHAAIVRDFIKRVANASIEAQAAHKASH